MTYLGKSHLLTIAVAALLPGTAFADPWVGKAPSSFLAKAGGTAEQRIADKKRCSEIVSKADSADMPVADEPDRPNYVTPMVAQYGLAGVGGALIAAGIFAMVDDADATRRGEDLCMYNLGYRVINMTKAETAVDVPRSKQRNWVRDYMPANTGERLAPLLKPVVPRLLAYETEAPLVDGGIRIAGLTLVSPEIHGKGFVVKGTATLRRTTTLVTPIETKEGAIRVAADVGTIFQEVDYRAAKEPMLRQDSSTWCGPARQMAAGNVAKDFVCFTGRDNGYEVFEPSGYSWLAGPGAVLTLPLHTQPIQLEERKQDEPAPMDVEIKVVRIESSGVYLACDARYKGEVMRIWLRRIKFEKDVAVLPLWDSKLTLTREAAAKQTDAKQTGAKQAVLKAELTHDGDGKSWRVGEEARGLFEY